MLPNIRSDIWWSGCRLLSGLPAHAPGVRKAFPVKLFGPGDLEPRFAGPCSKFTFIVKLRWRLGIFLLIGAPRVPMFVKGLLIRSRFSPYLKMLEFDHPETPTTLFIWQLHNELCGLARFCLFALPFHGGEEC